ncbi:hypothetical protein ACVBEH_09905 [Roseateles sp. GG27B]
MQVVAPLGIGGHVDHLIARKACEQVFGAASWPITRTCPTPERRGGGEQRSAGRRPCRANWRWISPRKQQVLRAYASEMPLLFKSAPKFAELLLLPS